MVVKRPVKSVSRPNLTCPHKSGSALVVNSAQNTPIHTGMRNAPIAQLSVLEVETFRFLALSITSGDIGGLPPEAAERLLRNAYCGLVARFVSLGEPSGGGGSLLASAPRIDRISLTTAVSA